MLKAPALRAVRWRERTAASISRRLAAIRIREPKQARGSTHQGCRIVPVPASRNRTGHSADWGITRRTRALALASSFAAAILGTLAHPQVHLWAERGQLPGAGCLLRASTKARRRAACTSAWT